MTVRMPARNGSEVDAVSRRARKVMRWRAGVRRWWMTKYRRAERRWLNRMLES